MINDWKSNIKEAEEIFYLGLGWKVTDFGLGSFLRQDYYSLLLEMGSRIVLTYVGKIMIVREDYPNAFS